MLAKKLKQILLNDAAVVEIVLENFLNDFLVFLSGGSSEEIKVDFEVLINSLMNRVKLVADFLRSAFLLHGLRFSCSSILVCSAYVNRVVIRQLAEPAVNVSRQNGSNQVSQMRLVVDIGQGRCDQNIVFVVGINVLDTAFVALQLLRFHLGNVVF